MAGYRIIQRPGEGAYKGYLIRHTMHGWSISKDGQHIAWAKSADEARRTIDELA